MMRITDKITELALKCSEATRSSNLLHFNACITLACRKYGREFDRYDRNKALEMLKLVASLRKFDDRYKTLKHVVTRRKAKITTAPVFYYHNAL